MNARTFSAEHAAAVAAVDEWFKDLAASRGPLAMDDPLLVDNAYGWNLSTFGRQLAVVVKQDFPYTKPKVYVRGPRPHIPHVEADGCFCLKSPALPSDPVLSVSSAISSARDLLRAAEEGSEDSDFTEDFGAYWNQQASVGRSELLMGETDASGPLWWTATQFAHYGFTSPGTLKRWWQNRFGTVPRKVRRGAVIRLEELPHPSRYPSTGVELWNLVASGSTDGLGVLSELLRSTPKEMLVVLSGTAASGRKHHASVLLQRPEDRRGRPVHRRHVDPTHHRRAADPEDICGSHVLTRLTTQLLDAARSRLPFGDLEALANAKVAVVGCGALGSGVARLLAKSGVGNLILIDPEILGWENVRRHVLGGEAVGQAKAAALATAMTRAHPEAAAPKAMVTRIEPLLLEHPAALENLDLLVSCTANWSANAAIDRWRHEAGVPVVYGWLETHALASHAVLVTGAHSYVDGFDAAGSPRLAASGSNKPVPAECGASTSPYGALELGHAETLVARLAIDALRGKAGEAVWKTWLTDEETLTDAEGFWTLDWLTARGPPQPTGEISVADWW